MRPGRYAAEDGSFSRSAGGTLGRGVLLLAVALVIGIVLLNATESDPPGTRASDVDLSAGQGDTGEDSADRPATTTTSGPTTTSTATRQPKDVKVLVINASEVKGAAGKASDALKPPGYNVLAPTNATSKESAVYFTPGYDRDAAGVAGVLGFAATTVKPLPAPPPVPDTKGANVVVVLGPDQATRFGTAPAGGSTTTTARAGAATTTTARSGAVTTVAPATTTTAKP